MRRVLLTLIPAAALCGCNMAPVYVRPSAPVPARWPQGTPYVASSTAEKAGLPWTLLIGDPKLKTVIERALSDNRDLRVALANVLSARAQYRIQRAAQLPAVTGEAGSSIARQNGVVRDSYSGNVGFSAFEIDLFGRLKNLSEAALQTYLASEEGARSTRIALVAETANAYATLAADQELLAVARETLASTEHSLALIRSLNRAGLTDKLDVHQAETTAEQARSDVASGMAQLAQDRNALDLLVGAPVESTLLPQSLQGLADTVARVPAGLSSDVLLQRPDVLQAEHQLKAANADIGAARAAMFPRISLTAAIGAASSALSSLFSGGAFAWSAAPSASVPVFGGSARGNLDYSKAQRDRYLAQYELAIQTAFREVSDALARAGTIDEQLGAQRRLVVASQRAFALSQERYRAGIDTFLNSLVNQRAFYSAQRSAIATQLKQVQNRLTLYRVIGADF
ncbi:efflux transporter outer membrane subunit [Sphingobium bisphenolivorans]|uniref:efflux transporter outer membrane subunit n=1 Tax=Sphingobium bisphenolivorans TaxID=1335760 RepID=UPI0003B5E6BC|nr:efflux transporter outer membrane subunit [Sphingobium bisphenolivorans]